MEHMFKKDPTRCPPKFWNMHDGHGHYSVIGFKKISEDTIMLCRRWFTHDSYYGGTNEWHIKEFECWLDHILGRKRSSGYKYLNDSTEPPIDMDWDHNEYGDIVIETKQPTHQIKLGVDAVGGVTHNNDKQWTHGCLTSPTILKAGITQSVYGTHYNFAGNIKDGGEVIITFINYLLNLDGKDGTKYLKDDMLDVMVPIDIFNGKRVFVHVKLKLVFASDLKCMIDLLGMFAGRNPFICKMTTNYQRTEDKWYYYKFRGYQVKIEFFDISLTEDFRNVTEWLTESDIDKILSDGDDLPAEFVTLIPREYILKCWDQVEARREEIIRDNPREDGETSDHYKQRIQRILENELKAMGFIYKRRGITIAIIDVFDSLHLDVRSVSGLYSTPMNIAHRYSSSHYQCIPEIDYISDGAPKIRPVNNKIKNKLLNASQTRDMENTNFTGDQKDIIWDNLPIFYVKLSVSEGYTTEVEIIMLLFVILAAVYHEVTMRVYNTSRVNQKLCDQLKLIQRYGLSLLCYQRIIVPSLLSNKVYLMLNKASLPLVARNMAEKTMHNGTGTGAVLWNQQGTENAGGVHKNNFPFCDKRIITERNIENCYVQQILRRVDAFWYGAHDHNEVDFRSNILKMQRKMDQNPMESDEDIDNVIEKTQRKWLRVFETAPEKNETLIMMMKIFFALKLTGMQKIVIPKLFQGQGKLIKDLMQRNKNKITNVLQKKTQSTKQTESDKEKSKSRKRRANDKEENDENNKENEPPKKKQRISRRISREYTHSRGRFNKRKGSKNKNNKNKK